MARRFQVLKDELPQEKAFIVHASESWFDSICAGQFDFFEKLASKAQSEGLTPWIVRSESNPSRRILQRDHIHILIGPRRPVGRNIFHAHPSYIWGFWYLDPLGVHWESSLAGADFAADSLDQQAAEYFFNGVSGYMLRENISKFPQLANKDAQSPASAVIYLQELEHYKTAVHYLTSEIIIQTVAQSVVGKVFVKFHPVQSQENRAALQSICAQHGNVEISRQSIHDLSNASEVVITQNSAAGFEALMQRKPVITCGKSDYHHATLAVKTKVALRNALVSAVLKQQTFPFEKYFYWFLGLNMLEPSKPDFEQRAWQILRP